MGFLASVQFTMALQVVETTEAHLTIGADIGLLLAVSQEVALEIMVARKFGVTVWALVFL